MKFINNTSSNFYEDKKNELLKNLELCMDYKKKRTRFLIITYGFIIIGLILTIYGYSLNRTTIIPFLLGLFILFASKITLDVYTCEMEDILVGGNKKITEYYDIVKNTNATLTDLMYLLGIELPQFMNINDKEVVNNHNLLNILNAIYVSQKNIITWDLVRDNTKIKITYSENLAKNEMKKLVNEMKLDVTQYHKFIGKEETHLEITDKELILYENIN